MSALRYMKNEEKFTLTGEEQAQALELEAYPAATPDDSEAFQVELFLPESNPEAPQPSPQIEFEGMPIPRYEISINEHRSVYFQHANTLLESLEAQDVDVHYQCRKGYCGSCRVQLLEGEVYYYEEPLAWVNNNEILTCCCIPKSDLKIKL